MNILITGGTGFIGSALSEKLIQNNEHTLTILSRKPRQSTKQITYIFNIEQLQSATHFDAVINLAGEPIADKRWSAKQQQKITSSRINTTENLIHYFKTQERKPTVFISGSAIGYYGISTSDEEITEQDSGDNSFASTLCAQWESTATKAEDLGIRTCILRTGIVLGKSGGALGKMLPPFKMGLGGAIGNGAQWMPWIHLDDLVGIILHCLENNEISGAINGVAPHPVTNAEFTKTLGSILRKPTFFTLPTFMVRLLMGQMGEELLLAGKKVIPTKALETNYTFEYPNLEPALTQIIQK